MRAVNLLPKELQNAKSIRHEDPAVVVGSALGVIVMIALGASFFVAHASANAEQARLTAARLELAQLAQHQRPAPKPSAPSAPITPIVPAPAITGQEASWLSAVSTNLSQRIAWDRLLREVSLVIPDDVTLVQLTLTAPTAASAGAGATPGAQGFVIQGSAFSYDSVARLLSRLALVPDLSNVTLTNTSSGGLGSGAAVAAGVEFNITAEVKDPAVTAAAAAAAAATAAAAAAQAQATGTTTG